MAAGGGSLIPFLIMILIQLGYAVMNITSKLAIQSGMNPLILVAYRQIFATISIIPFAYFLEWKIVPKMTKRIMVQIFLSSLTGVTGNQVLYFVGLKYSTATIACALTNLLPAFTFVLALIFRQENLRIKKVSGQMKVLGTVLCVSGALLLSFYHGKTIGLGQSSIHWSYADKMQGGSAAASSAAATGKTSLLLGPFALILSALVWALWFIIQADMSKSFPVPYTSTLYMCFLASFQCVIIALCFEHRPSAWSLHNAMRLTSSLYAGIICTGLSYCVISWTIERKGPLYVSVFTPLQLVLTAIISWALLQEKLYVGTAIGSLIIVGGLYAVLWGKSKEVEKKEVSDEELDMEKMKGNEKNDLEVQSYLPSNGNHNIIT